MKDLIIDYIKQTTGINQAECEITYFDSGAVIIDIKADGRFYVVQYDDKTIGLSELTDETGFDTAPDACFEDFDSFKTAFEKLF